MEFWEWITQKYIQWRGDAVGRERSISQFAQEIGVKQPTLSTWMQKSGRVPDGESIRKLADYFGPEIFEILGITSGAWGTAYLPADLRRRLERAVHETSQTLVDRSLSADDPEAEQLAIKIFERHGFKYTQTKKLP